MSADQNLPIAPGVPDQTSALALANAATVVIGVYQGIVGKDISDSINGGRVQREQLATMVTSRITKALIDRHNAAKNLRMAGY